VGYLTSKLKNEKTFFLDAVAKYRVDKLPLSTPPNMLKAWIIRFNEDYLTQQTFFEPCPEALMEPATTEQEREKILEIIAYKKAIGI
jgi:uncharacterized protein YbgA (DUF1722 family)